MKAIILLAVLLVAGAVAITSQVREPSVIEMCGTMEEIVKFQDALPYQWNTTAFLNVSRNESGEVVRYARFEKRGQRVPVFR